MATFIYEAYNREGVLTHGEYEGVNRDEVVGYLIKRDLTPVSVKKIRARGEGGGILSISLFERLSPVDVMFLVRNLATTIKAGLSVVEALDILIADAEKKLMKKVLQEAQAMIKNGQSLSSGFSAYKDSFPPVFMGMLRAGELSGQLDKILTELGKYLSKEYALRSKVKSALTYPIILLVASVGVMILLLVFVLPRLTSSFAASGVKLPFITQVFLSLSKMITWSITLDLVVVAGLVWFFVYFRTTNMGKRFFSWIIAHTPVANELVKKVALVRFSRTFGNLISSGVSAIEALELSSESIGNLSYELAIKNAITAVENGSPISEALGRFPNLFPRLLISLIIVGERTGSLHTIMSTFADFYEEEVDNVLKDLTSILEPALLLIMGLLVGAIAVSIILPIYQLVGHFV